MKLYGHFITDNKNGFAYVYAESRSQAKLIAEELLGKGNVLGGYDMNGAAFDELRQYLSRIANHRRGYIDTSAYDFNDLDDPLILTCPFKVYKTRQEKIEELL